MVVCPCQANMGTVVMRLCLGCPRYVINYMSPEGSRGGETNIRLRCAFVWLIQIQSLAMSTHSDPDSHNPVSQLAQQPSHGNPRCRPVAADQACHAGPHSNPQIPMTPRAQSDRRQRRLSPRPGPRAASVTMEAHARSLMRHTPSLAPALATSRSHRRPPAAPRFASAPQKSVPIAIEMATTGKRQLPPSSRTALEPESLPDRTWRYRISTARQGSESLIPTRSDQTEPNSRP